MSISDPRAGALRFRLVIFIAFIFVDEKAQYDGMDQILFILNSVSNL